MLLGQTNGNIRAFRIHINRLQLGPQHQIHVLHRDRPEQNLITQYHGPSEAATILESDLDGPDIGNRSPTAIRQDDLPLLKGLDLQLNRKVLWNTKVDSPRIPQSRDLNWMEVWAGGI